MKTVWLACAEVVRARYLWVLALCLLVTVALAFGIPRLEFKTSQDVLVSPSSEVYQDNLRYQRQFGGEPIIVLFEGDLLQLFASPNVEELAALEEELRQFVPSGPDGPGSGEDGALFHAVLGPLTTLRFAGDQIALAAELAPAALGRQQDEAADAARAEAAAAGALRAEQERAAQEARVILGEKFAELTAADAARLGGLGEASLDNPKFVEFLLFDATGAVRPELVAAFPDERHALMLVSLNGNMTLDEQAEAANRLVRLVEARDFEGIDVLPSGSAILLKEVNDTMRESIVIMGGLAVLAMFVLLFLIFRARWRLLSLVVVLVGNVWAFGLMGFLGIPLTLVTISGLPILIGVGVDFAIQVHSRIEEETQRSGSAARGLRTAFTNLGPALVVAVIAAIVGFLALETSDVPMIRDFGLMLGLGILVIFVAGVAIPAGVLFWRDRRIAPGPDLTASSLVDVERLTRGLTSSAEGLRILPALAVGIIFVGVGFWVDQRITVQTNPEKWIPQDSLVLQDLQHIRDAAGSSAQLGIMVEADDVTRTDILNWMAEFGARQMRLHSADLVTASSIGSIVAATTRAPPTREDAEAVLPRIPNALANTFISEDRTRAQIVFAIATNSLEEQRALLEAMEIDLREVPNGVTATPSGLAVIGVETMNALTENRTRMTYLALAVVAAWLLLYYRHVAKAMLPLIPALIAIGVSSTSIFSLGIDLSPLTALSGPLIVATCTEFSVLLMARYFEEREAGRLPNSAISTASTRIGRAFVASGLTTVAGFGVLAFSGFPLLTSFGIVTGLSVAIALLSTLIILPPLLVWVDGQIDLAGIDEPKGLPTPQQ